MGSGAYGVVVSAQDLEQLDEGELPKLEAIKKMINTFDD